MFIIITLTLSFFSFLYYIHVPKKIQYGGRSEMKVNSDIIGYNLLTQKWEEVVDTKMSNMAHVCHSFANGRHLCVWSGCDGKKLLKELYFYNIKLNIWSEPIMDNIYSPPPTARMAACLAAEILTTPDVLNLNENIVEKLYFFGGNTMQYDTNELYEIYVPKLPSEDEESRVDESNVISSETAVPSDAQTRTRTRSTSR